MRRGLFLMAAFALAGCSGDTPADGESAAPDAGASAAASVTEINAQPVTPSEGDVALTPLSSGARGALGDVEGACAFAYQERTLLWAGSPEGAPEKGRAVLVADGIEMMLDGQPGGQQAIVAGPALTGGEWRATVSRAEGSPEATGEGDRWSADLVVKGPRGEAKFSPGTWTCSS